MFFFYFQALFGHLLRKKPWGICFGSSLSFCRDLLDQI
jgi:hypothetical protein